MTVLILCIVEALGSPTYSHRDTAHRALAGCLDLAAPALLAAEEKHPDPEVRVRATLLLRPWFEKHAEELVACVCCDGRRKLPWLCFDGCYGDPCVKFYHAKTVYSGEPFDYHPRWLHYREATRLWLIHRIANRLPYRELLDQMREAELYYWRCQQQ